MIVVGCFIVLILAVFYQIYGLCRSSKLERTIRAYREKPKASGKVILIVESYGDRIENLNTMLWSVLRQTVRVDSISVVARSDDEVERLSSSNIARQSCVVSRIGGLTWFLKELDDDAVFLFVFSEGLYEFEDPTFVESYLADRRDAAAVVGVVKAPVKDYLVQLNEVYNNASNFRAVDVLQRF